METTPGLADRARRTRGQARAARTLLASLLSYNGLVREAQKAAGVVVPTEAAMRACRRCRAVDAAATDPVPALRRRALTLGQILLCVWCALCTPAGRAATAFSAAVATAVAVTLVARS